MKKINFNPSSKEIGISYYGTRKKNNGGFTLLEALVAISILMVAVAAPITIAQKGLSSAVYTKDQMTASYLAQDALEYIKNKRDEYSINHAYDWGNLTIFTPCLGVSTCEIDTNINNGDGQTRSFTSGILSKNDNNFYGFTGAPTIFSRKLNITFGTIGGNQDVAMVTAIVSWPTGSVTVKTLIYNY